jgi:hypothetical protein
MVATGLSSPKSWQFTAWEGLERAFRPIRDVSDFAAKRLHRTAQGFNPGLGGW